MSLHLRNGLKLGVIMLIVYLALELVAIRLGLLERVGWAGAIGATIAVVWHGHYSSQRRAESRQRAL